MAEHIDVFVIGGQSNATGHGTGGPAIPSGIALKYFNDTLSSATGDPIGSTGTAWPAFARRWYSITGRKICFVPAAVSGSALLPAAAAGFGDWSSSGSLFSAMTDKVTDAMSALSLAGWEPSFRGMLWSQGEAEAVAMSLGKVTAASYKAALENLVDRFVAAFPLSNLFIIQTGNRKNVSSAPYETVRSIQEGVAASKENAAVVHMTAYEFVGLGWLAPGSDIHWSQTGLNHVGKHSAEAIASGACFQKQWLRSVGVKGDGSALPWKQLVVEDASIDRRLTISGNSVSVSSANSAVPQNLGLSLNNGNLILGPNTKVYFGSSGCFVSSGKGSPENRVVAPKGSVFIRQDGALYSTLYIKLSGVGASGWTAR